MGERAKTTAAEGRGASTRDAAPDGPPSPEWLAKDAMIKRIEGLCGAPLEKIHARLDAAGCDSTDFASAVRRATNALGVSEVYAILALRTYRAWPGDAHARDLRAFLAASGRVPKA